MIQVQDSKEMLAEMQQQMDLIKQNIKEAQDKQKSYKGLKRSDHIISKGDMIFLRVQSKKRSFLLGSFKRLSEILWTICYHKENK